MIKHSGPILLVAVLAFGCGTDPEDTSWKLDEAQGAAGSTESGEGNASSSDAPANLSEAEDDKPISGFDAKALLAMERGTAEGRPCGILWPEHPEPIIRFGWDDQGRLRFFDYVIPPGEGPFELESRTVRFYDDQGRITDEVYIDGVTYEIGAHIWYQWDGQEMLRRNVVDRGPNVPVGEVEIEADQWSVGDSVWKYDESALRLEFVQSTPGSSSSEWRVVYELKRPVTAEETIILEGMHGAFEQLGPIAKRSYYAGDSLQNEIEYIFDEDGNTAWIGESQLLYDCSNFAR